MKIIKKDLILFSELRRNARESLTRLSRRTRIPVSTLHDRLKLHTGSLIKKNCALIDFSKLGFSTRATVLLKVNPQKRKELMEYLIKNKNVNTLLRVNNDYDFMVELIFKNLKESEDFIDNLEENYDITDKKTCYIVDEIKREDFMSDPQLVDLLVSNPSNTSN